MYSQDTIKITFAGDLMCDMYEIPAYKTEDGYNFSNMFKYCKDYFSSSDYVVGNLETPIANAEYSNKLYSFNSPIEYVKAIKDNGFSMVATANNHCLDRGISGLEDTIDVLDAIGLKHTGTNKQNIKPTGIIENIDGIKVGFLAYTYGTNAYSNNLYLNKNEKWKVNLYQEQELHNSVFRFLYKSKPAVFFRKAVNFLGRLLLRRKIFYPVWERTEKRSGFLKKIREDICALKSAGAEYTVMYLHAGGQFNVKVSKETKNIAHKIAKLDVDAIIVNHEHLVHYVEKFSNKIIAYCLGDFTCRCGIDRPPYKKMANYSILFNLYLSKKNNIVEPVNLTFSIIKRISDGIHRVKTMLLFDLINDCTDEEERKKLLLDNLKIYNLFRNSKEADIELKLEYSL